MIKYFLSNYRHNSLGLNPLNTYHDSFISFYFHNFIVVNQQTDKMKNFWLLSDKSESSVFVLVIGNFRMCELFRLLDILFPIKTRCFNYSYKIVAKMNVTTKSPQNWWSWKLNIENFRGEFSIQINYIVSVVEMCWLHLREILSINSWHKEEAQPHFPQWL